MVKEFRDFILRGNVVDLAVAVVIGVAFGALVTSFVENIITPLIAAIIGEPNFSGLSFSINDSEFFYGSFLNALIAFASIAAVVFFFVVKPMNVLLARYRKEPEPVVVVDEAPLAAPMSPEAERFLAELTRVIRQIEPR